MGDESDGEYRCLVKFPDQSASFVHGFECGTHWRAMETGAEIERVAVHDENVECLERMCNAAGYEPEFEKSDVHGWTWFEARPAPKGLRVIDGGQNG